MPLGDGVAIVNVVPSVERTGLRRLSPWVLAALVITHIPGRGAI